MPFNPCGRVVDFLADSVTDVIRPFRDSELTVRRRWYRVPWGTPTIGVLSVFISNHFKAFKELQTGPGEVFPPEIDYTRRGTPDGLLFDHICGDLEQLQNGALLDPAVNVVYDDEWIPECCGRESVCTTQLCGQAELNGYPAAQLWSYPINHQDATATTPVVLFQRAMNLGNTDPPTPGELVAWYPAGTAGEVRASVERLANQAGVPQSETRTFRIDDDNATSYRQDAAGDTWTFERGGVSGELTFRIVGGQLEVCGTNAVICAELMPEFVTPNVATGLVAAGTDQATAAAVTTTTTQAVALASTAGVRLPAGGGGIVSGEADGRRFVVVHVNSSPAATLNVYPAAGESLDGYAVNAPHVLARGTGCIFVAHGGANGGWSVIPYPPAAVGTVTSVDLGTSSAGLTVGGGPVTSSGTLTVDLADDLEQLVGFPLAAAIPVGDGSGNWNALEIGDGLDLTAGVLSAVPPGDDSDDIDGAGFSITGTSGTYQATGITMTLPAAGRYMIWGRVCAGIQVSASANSYVAVKLRDVTNGADVPRSDTLAVWEGAGATLNVATVPVDAIVDVTGATTIELYAARVGANWTYSAIVDGANSRTEMHYARIA